ncbi:hypothetical protein [Duganella vulcania]|uniref:Uncharacterized protein n=1 Tax=Duganella vulcania TaxID=2692166 RepID=A0A845GR79_9BURK|nr:hypothetical protein [Duganella vulcania]MYM95940.1 hypothetical protein [Duganella vulcania]
MTTNFPIPADPDEFFMSMAVFSAFIDKGMRACPDFPALVADGPHERRLVDDVAKLVLLAVRLERAILAVDGLLGRPRGSVEQNVCEPFGAWYVGHCLANGGVSAYEVCRSHLAEALIDYFTEGQAPLDVWSTIRAIKAEEPTLMLCHEVVANSINWEWAPRFVVANNTNNTAEHPLHPRSAWRPKTGPVHVSEYWPWVEHCVREAYVRSRYQALTAAPDVFMQLVMAKLVFVEGCRLRDLQVRHDLAGQEVIESLPARTAFSAGLFEALPALRQAVLALAPGFDPGAWIGRPVSDFMSEYVVAADPDSTAVVTGKTGQSGEGRSVAITLAALWNGVPESSGVWRLEDGAVLKLVGASAADVMPDTGGEFATA